MLFQRSDKKNGYVIEILFSSSGSLVCCFSLLKDKDPGPDHRQISGLVD